MDKSTPKYQELVRWINEQIQENKLMAGDRLYSENKLKEMFGVSRQTVRHAISVLEQDGIVRRVQGSGTYINDNRLANLAKRMRVSVVTTYVDGYIFPRTIQGIENVLLEAGYSVQIAFTNNQNGKERTILEDIISRDEVAGIIVEATKSGIPNPNLPLYQEICKRRIPIVFINSFYPQLELPHVSINDRMAGQKMTRHLIEKGHKKIGGIFKLDDGQGRLRYTGYMDAMLEAGLEIDDTRILWIDTEDVKHPEKMTDRILARLQDCTGVFCYNDEVAFGLLEILKKAGIRVPQDLSIVGIDDSELAVLGDVEITSAPHPMEHLGQKAAENLLRLIKDPYFDADYEFDVEIVERESVAKI
jgi:GntR family transcriptional regulator of arabinose operon